MTSNRSSLDVRAARLADFAERASSSVDSSAFRRFSALGDCIIVNPMSDETELLASIGMAPHECNKVDLYLKAHGDVHFVQVHSVIYDVHRSPGLYARLQDDDVYLYNFVCVVADQQISESVVSRCLQEIHDRLGALPSLSAALKRI